MRCVVHKMTIYIKYCLTFWFISTKFYKKENQRTFLNQIFKREIIRHSGNIIFWIIQNEPRERRLAECEVTLWMIVCIRYWVKLGSNCYCICLNMSQSPGLESLSQSRELISYSKNCIPISIITVCLILFLFFFYRKVT